MGRALHPAQQRARMANLPEGTLDAVRARISAHASVALHFHPDRPVPDGRTIAAALLADGVYRSQFETGVSAGSVTAHPGGARDRWEHLLFGGAYRAADVTAAHRPKYGALDLLGAPDGPAPRFGSCRFVLRPAVSARATFTYLDSHDDPREKGTLDELDLVLAALFTESFTREYALGEHDLPPGALADRLLGLGTPGDALGRPGDVLGTPGDVLGTPGDVLGRPGDVLGTPGDVLGTPGDAGGAPGDTGGALGARRRGASITMSRRRSMARCASPWTSSGSSSTHRSAAPRRATP